MKRNRAIVWGLLLNLCLLYGVSMGGGEFERLTNVYQPPEWKLYPIVPNPMALSTSTELSIPEAVKLSIAIYPVGADDTLRSPVRRIVEPEDGVFPPGIYSVRWSLCDSLDLPVTTSALYRLIVSAYSESAPDRPAFQNSTSILALVDSWKDLAVDSGDFDIRVLEGWTLEKQGLVEAKWISPYPRTIVRAARRLNSVDSTDSDRVVISLGSLNQPFGHYVPLTSVKGYLCRSDDTQPSGYRIEDHKGPFWGLDTAWELDLGEGDLLLLFCDSDWPIVLDPSVFLAKLRAAGEIK